MKNYFKEEKPNREINFGKFTSKVAELLFEYADLDKNDSLSYKELNDILDIYSNYKSISDDFEITLLEAGYAVYKKGVRNKDLMKHFGFDSNLNVRPEVFLAALKTDKNLFDELSNQVQFDKSQIDISKDLGALVSIAEQLWHENFDVTKNENYYITSKTGYQHFKKISANNKLKKKIKESYKPQNINTGVLINETNKRNIVLSLGDKFNGIFTKDFTNPAKLLFKSSAGEETDESLNLALRLDVINFDSWKHSFGYSIEKSTSKSKSNDIRSYHYALSKNIDIPEISDIQFGFAYQDNFSNGYENWVGNITFMPNISWSRSCGQKTKIQMSPSTWLDLPSYDCFEISTSKWQFFYTPLVGIEVNELKQRPNELDIVVNDDEHFIFAELQTGLKKGQFEIIYSNIRRYNISGGNHLSFQTIDFDYYFDKSKRFSIGLSGKRGQRPIDLNKLEDYEISFGFRL
ncbi:MAG: hypothetical protein DWP95_08840 [Proteobacteria bacterium]|nr:MAG: hypothetical protein DWP95_08840 [Pseudomonadota bacterium]